MIIKTLIPYLIKSFFKWMRFQLTVSKSQFCYHSYDQIDYINVLTVCSIKNRSKLVKSVFRGILRSPISLSGPDVNNIILLHSTDPRYLLNVT